VKWVIGFGVSGQGVVRWIRTCLKEACGVWDIKPKVSLFPDVHIQTEPPSFDEVDEVIVSSGIPYSLPWLVEARQRGIPVHGEAEYILSKFPYLVIAVTGSLGKSSTVRLLEHLCRLANIKVQAVGNIGLSLGQALSDLEEKLLWIVELSSYQIEWLEESRVDMSFLLNLYPNHLDRYDSLTAYYAAKLRLREKTKEMFWVASQVQTLGMSQTLGCPVFDAPGIPAMPVGASVSEMMWAVAYRVGSWLGISLEVIYEACQSFVALPHRLELTARWDGKVAYNDSKATSVNAVLYAVQRLPRSIVLLVGGVDKGSDYRPWIQGFDGCVKRLFGFGPAARLIEVALGGRYQMECYVTLQEATIAALDCLTQGDTLLLSPGGASFDQFAHFEQRGDAFKSLVWQYVNKVSAG
jgi:UDP-N-acetylmuramoylalanine--D-glutamate ligase